MIISNYLNVAIIITVLYIIKFFISFRLIILEVIAGILHQVLLYFSS